MVPGYVEIDGDGLDEDDSWIWYKSGKDIGIGGGTENINGAGTGCGIIVGQPNCGVILGSNCGIIVVGAGTGCGGMVGGPELIRI